MLYHIMIFSKYRNTSIYRYVSHITLKGIYEDHNPGDELPYEVYDVEQIKQLSDDTKVHFERVSISICPIKNNKASVILC